jgi:hypothetical protein
MAYAFDFINRDGSIDHFELGLFNDRAAALDAAKAALYASTSAVEVDVWDEADRVAKLTRAIQSLRPSAFGAAM